MNEKLSMLEAEFKKLCGILGSKANFFASPCEDGSAHVKYLDDIYWYIVTERGEQLERRSTRDESEMLYWLLSDVIFDLAMNFERKHRDKDVDFRRSLFAKEVELMTMLNPTWGKRKESEIDAILLKSPFLDTRRV